MPDEHTSDLQTTKEIIVEVLGENCSIALTTTLGGDATRTFEITTDGRTLFHMFGDDEGLGPDASVSVKGPVDTWEKALALLDCYAWTMLSPQRVHPDFQAAVWTAVLERAADKDAYWSDFNEDRLDDWKRVCGVDLD